MKIIFYSHAHFYKKGFALALLVSKVRIVGTRNIACSHLISFSLLTHSSVNLKREAEPDVQQDHEEPHAVKFLSRNLIS